MRIAIASGLIGLGVAGGTIPTGLAGIAHAGAVFGGTAAALALLVGVCLAAPMLVRRRSHTTGPGAKVARFRPPIRSPARRI
ncbi:MAG TPA: hypothetical protein VJU81_15830 [Methylomirabilota bacterium]|nr:hypothetical protein [Methylomirabilota bacterium]